MDNALPAKLSRYTTGELEYLVALLTEEKLHVSNPKNFNDPWDSKPFLHTAEPYEPLGKKIIDTLIMHISPLPSMKEIYALRRHLSDPIIFKKHLFDMTDMLRERFSFHRVCCLSNRHNCELMWAHYADKHKGIRLEFSTQTAPFSYARKVIYQKDYPKIYPIPGKDNNAGLLIKSEAWGYEEEYRVLFFDEKSPLLEQVKVPQDLITTEDKVPCDLSGLISITFGCQFTPEEIHRYVDVLAPLAPPTLQFKAARKAENQYKLIVEDI